MRRLFSLLICVVATTAVFAQETNCTNGLDDDGDGFIDCYDPDCALNTACDDIFIGNDATCTLTPPPAPAFTMKLDFVSENETTNHFSRVAIGDLDRDGIPEIVTMNKYTKTLFVLNGSDTDNNDTITVKHQAIMANGASPEWEIAIANIDDDNCAEIFFLATDNRIYVYDCQLNFLYRTPTMPGDPINFGIADFGGDGRVEIYAKDEIFNAHTGARLRATTNPNWNTRLNGGPVAVDMNGDGDLELVIGLAIYDVNPAATTLTLLNSRPEYFIRNVYNATSVADFNQDGSMDVIASGSTGCHSGDDPETEGNTTIFFWDVANNVLRTYSDRQSKYSDGLNSDGINDYKEGWQNGTGRVNIADLDGDGQLNLSYVSGGYLYALREDLTLLWKKDVKEQTSGYTGCTLFDFNGDGKSEVVYRDEAFLYIIDGVDGSTFGTPQACISRTNREYPIVADLDADGSTEICVTCGYNDAASSAQFTNTGYSRYSHVRVFESSAEPWVPARRVWNQHGYFVVNVNDDLSIPILQQNHSKQFSTVACRPGDPVGPIRPLNKFLNQSPFIDTNGCPAYLAPDLAYATAINFIPPTCPDLDFQVQFTITNLGEVPISGAIPVSFYDGNPLRPGANKITTRTFNIVELDKNELFVVNELITSNGTDSLFVALNDAGNQTPPITFPNTPFLECNYDNVRGIAISPLPVAISALEVAPSELCHVPPNGAARAFIPMGGGVENTADYDFYWYNGTTVGSIATAIEDAPDLLNVVAGTYSVFGIHKTANCSSDTAQVVITPAPGILPTVTVTLVSNQTNCDPPNGSLEASVSGGNSGYTFEWEDIAAPIGVSGPQLTNRNSGTYTVIVTHTASGCETSADGTIGDLTQEPDVVATATPVTSCTNLLSGTLSAEAFKGLTPQPDANYVFEWYFYDNVAGVRGSLIPPVHGALGTPDRTGLPIGFYEVTITEIATGCTGNPTGIVQVADQRVTLVASITELTPQTSCDPANPNGRFQASVTIGGVPQPASNFTFEWFVGQNTLPINAHTTVSGTNGSIAEKVKGGGQSYTVRATNANNCFDIEDEVISEDINLPVVTLTTAPNGICNPLLASSTFTGSATASVTFDGTQVAFPNPNYSFRWYNGTQAVGAPRPETTNPLTQLDSGYYTLVVTRTDLGCAAAPETEFVDNTTVLPVILTDTDSSTNCTPIVLPGVTPNGLARVRRVDGANPNLATHSFLWHDGINATTGQISGATNPSLGSLQGGVGEFYTVLVTNRSNGCQNTATVEIPDAQSKPIITLLPSDNSVCDPLIAGTAKNGSVLIQTVTYKGAPFVGARTHQWYDGVGTGLPNTSTTAATLPDLGAGFYSATVTLTATGCVSDFVPAEVEDDFVPIDIVMTPKPSTNCPGGAANGEFAAAVDVAGVPTTTGFSFKWFEDIGMTTPVLITPNNGETPTAIQLQGGNDFTVEVTRLNSGCKNTETMILQDDSEVPEINPLDFSPNLNCTLPFNGSADVDDTTPFTYRGLPIAAPYTGFNLAWSGGTVNVNGDGITALAAGPYTLIVTAINDNCISSPEPVTILDNLTPPSVAIAPVDQTSCDPGAPNGILTATVGGGTAGHTFRWFQGVGTSAPAVEITDPGTPNIIDGLAAGDYTALVMNQTTRCERILPVVLGDDIVNPTINFTNINDVTTCAPPNGSVRPIVTGVSPMPNTNFTIFYVRTFSDLANPGTPPSNPAVIKASTETYSSTSAIVNGTNPPDVGNLMPGYVTGLVVDNFTKCESNPETVQIIDATVDNLIQVLPGATAGFCGGNGGTIPVNISGGTGAYTFAWYSGTPSNTDINFFNNPPNMSSATFIASVEDLGVVTPAGGVGAGTYTLVVTDAAGCGAYAIDNVGFAGAPTITVTPTNPERCVAPFDGQINVTVAGASGPYSIAIYNGNSPVNPSIKGEVCDDGVDNDGDGFIDGADPDCGVTNLTTTGLASGQYLVRVIDYTAANRPCPLDEGVVLRQEAFAPLVAIDQINANTACDVTGNSDGSVELTVSMDGQDARNAGTTPVAFEVFSVTPAPRTPPAFPSNLSSGVATVSTTLNYGFSPQAYSVTINEVASGCKTTQSVIVPNQPVMPALGQADVTPTNDSFCAPNSNGGAEVTSITPAAIANYEFSWFSNLASPPVFQANGAGGTVFNRATAGAAYVLGALGQGTGTQTFFVRAERLAGTGLGVGCTTPAVQVTIQDTHVTPVLTLNSVPDTSCDPSIGEGSISVATVTTSPSDLTVQNAMYVYTLNPGPSEIVLPPQSGALSTPFTQLLDGAYTVRAVNQVSACPVIENRTIDPGIFNVIITDAFPIDKLICSPDGEIEVQEIIIDRSLSSLPPQVFNTSPLTTDFEFRWFKNTPGSFTTGTPLADDVTSATIVTEDLVIGGAAGEYNDPAPTLGAGTYYVVARQLTGVGKFGAFCESTPTRVEILDKSEDPVVALTPATDTSCDGPAEGSIRVLVTDPMPPGALGYNYTWTVPPGPGPFTNPFTGTNNLFSSVPDGAYELRALNNLTGCESIATQTTVSKTAIPIVVASATHTDQLICNPDGSITVVDITVNGVIDTDHDHFNFMWYRDAVVPGSELVPFAPPALPGNDVLDNTDAPTIPMGAGTYFVKAQRVLGLPLGSGCESAPFRVDILDQSVDPDVVFSSVKPDSSCNVLNPLGMLRATAAERDGTTDTYLFAWTFNGAPIASPPTSPTNQLNNLAAGNYVVTVTNDPITGCSFTRGITLQLDTTRSLPNIVDVDTVDPLDCRPTGGNATVTAVTVGGRTTYNSLPALDNLFDYEWRRSGSPTVIGTQHNQSPMLPGIFFVSVTEVNTGCSSSLVQVFIDSAKRVLPVVAIQQTAAQASCNAAFGTGSLAATADGQTDANLNYAFTWYPSTDLSGTSFATTSTVTGLFSGGYSVEAQDLTTLCTASALFIVPVDSLEFLPQLILTSGPLTECDSIDGAVFIRGLRFPVTPNLSDNYPFPTYDYTADLYVGDPPANMATPEHPNVPNDPNNPGFLENFVQPNLVNGIYTVRLTDNNTGCITVDTVSVEDARVFPNPTITEIAPVINCDPLRPNGVARAMVNGSVLGHYFDWFEGPTATGSVIYNGPQFDELHPAPIQYTVLATHIVTGCTGDVTGTISNGQLTPPSPDIKLLSNVTSCLENNGALSVSVDGNIVDYIFNWFDPPPNFVGTLYDSLAVGTYSVTATSRKTGCVSPPTSEDVIATPEFPDIDFEIKPASCGQNNGSATLVIISPVTIGSVTWFDANGATVNGGPILAEAYAGTYSVLVTTVLGCESEEEIVIGTEVRPRNFISRNGDNSNSYFHIDCIENFTIANGAAHDNKVKIFNRVGTLVYEMDGYDNVDIYFNGKSNKGVGTNLMGTNLPDGTYFFIVDKRNGERPIEGYIEIVN